MARHRYRTFHSVAVWRRLLPHGKPLPKIRAHLIWRFVYRGRRHLRRLLPDTPRPCVQQEAKHPTTCTSPSLEKLAYRNSPAAFEHLHVTQKAGAPPGLAGASTAAASASQRASSLQRQRATPDGRRLPGFQAPPLANSSLELQSSGRCSSSASGAQWPRARRRCSARPAPRTRRWPPAPSASPVRGRLHLPAYFLQGQHGG